MSIETTTPTPPRASARGYGAQQLIAGTCVAVAGLILGILRHRDMANKTSASNAGAFLATADIYRTLMRSQLRVVKEMMPERYQSFMRATAAAVRQARRNDATEGVSL